jgi:diaminopimelate decarboxylase
VESEPELLVLNEVALKMNKQANIAFRINPDIDAKTHAKISTGKFINKFGLSWKRIRKICATARELPGIHVQGIAMHIGSQLTELLPYEQAFNRLAELAGELKNDGHDITVLDIGGGLGIAYDKTAPLPPAPSEYAKLAFSILGKLGCKIVIEPGRSLVGTAGILVSRVVYVKQGETDRFLIIDAGMNDFLRPSLYDACHAMIPEQLGMDEKVKYQVVGPVCETGDTFATNYELPRFEPGELIAILDTGAYGAAMSFTYNTRPLPPEVLVNGENFRVVRKRQSYDELIGMDL